jgi:hypothetical protein
MARRAVGGALVVTSALLGAPPSSADAPPAPQYPLATCATRVNDILDDAAPKYSVQNFEKYAEAPDPRGSVDGLDITAVTFRLTATRVYAFMTLKDVPEKPRDTDSAYGYRMWFSRGPKIARFDQVFVNPTHLEHGLAPAPGTGDFPTASVGETETGGTTPLSGLGGGIDVAKDVVYVYGDRASLEAQLGGPLADGDELTGIHARTFLRETDGKLAAGVVTRPADTTEATGAAAVQKVGDNRCFAASTVTVSSPTAQYGDRVTLSATLADEAGAPMAGRQVAFTVPGESGARTLTTDAAGAVTVVLPSAPAGTTRYTVTYRGDDFTGDGLGRGTLTTRPETIRMAPLKVARSGTARTVTATLTEDDPRAFAKQKVDWYVNGKKVATVVTDAGGRSVFKGARAGQKVQARYAGLAGRYSAVKSAVVTV